MSSIQPCEIPPGTLLSRYLGGGAYADCYLAEIAWPVSLAEYVTAFYTTPMIKLERLLLAWLVSRPSTDAQAKQLASGTLNAFSAWNVESRAANQLLLSDFRGRTRSWLMVATLENETPPGTRLYFGSAVVPVIDASSGQPTLGFTYRALLGFHKRYSRALLRAARHRLLRSRRSPRN